MSRFASVLCAVVVLLPAYASADAIGPPPASCPEGSRGIMCHGPDTCALAGCMNTTDCNPGEICEQRALCVREHCCSGIACSFDGGMPRRVTHVADPCGAGRACAAFGTTCESQMVCVPDPAIDAGPPAMDGGGGVDAGGEADAGGDADAGDVDMDAGSTDDDAGPNGGMDSGPAGGADAGPGGSDGGCCSVYGRGNPAGGVVALMVIGLAALRLRRRR